MTTTSPPPARMAPASPAPVSAERRARRHARRLLRGDLLAILVWASAAGALALYLASGVRIASPADALTAAGIAAGLVGSDLVLVMLVLAARVPLIDRVVGHDRAMGLHRAIGKPAFALLLAHGALLTLGYAASEGSSLVAETVSLFGSPDLPLAYLSIALFATVIVTSLVAVRRRFPYEFWYVVHLLSYAAVITAIPHQFSQGAMLASGTWQRVYWIGLYVIALGSIAVFRVAEPLVRSARHRIVVDHVDAIGSDALAIHLRGDRLDRLGAVGGQFFQWRFWTRSTWWHAHPVSLSAAPTPTGARITVRVVGDGTRRLARSLAPGTPVTFSGPFGLFTDAARGHRRVAVLAAGIGVTPARALLEELAAEPGEVGVLVRASDREALYHWDEVTAICARRGWSAWASVGPRADGENAWLSRADAQHGVTLDSVFPDLTDTDVYICGSDAWADVIETGLAARGVRPGQIHRERFDW